MIPYDDLGRVNAPYHAALDEAFRSVMDRGWFILGEAVQRFERDFALAMGGKHCIGVASGLDALTLSFIAMEVPKGSEVIVAANTYIATILGVMHAGLVPVLVEPDAATRNIDPERIEAAVTSKTRAICVTHLYGKPCPMDRVMAVAKRHGLRVVEDCAQSHAATWQGRTTGTWGDTGAFSFYPTKNLGALGDGGAILVDDDALAERLLYLRNYGSKTKYYNKYFGFNSRLDELQAAFLSVKLPHLPAITAHRRRLAEIYFAELPRQVEAPSREADGGDVFHIFAIRTPQRDRLRAHLQENGIKVEVHYPVAPHRQEAMQGVITGDYPISQAIHETILSLPVSTCHTEDDVREVCRQIRRFFA